LFDVADSDCHVVLQLCLLYSRLCAECNEEALGALEGERWVRELDRW